jgi:hypothetical protein
MAESLTLHCPECGCPLVCEVTRTGWQGVDVHVTEQDCTCDAMSDWNDLWEQAQTALEAEDDPDACDADTGAWWERRT